jgi:hypothetical protein
MFNFKSEKKTEKIYKFVYEPADMTRRDNKKTMLVTACTPVQAVKKFNNMTKDKLFNIVEFTEIVHKTEESKQ